MKIGYARVSSTDQNLARQIEALNKEGCTKIFQEKVSGKNTERPQLQEMLNYIHDEDVVVIMSLDRLGRNSQDIKDLLSEIRQKGATIDILDLPSFQGVEDPNLKNLLTNIVIELMSYVAQSEREKIRERQREGIAIAKKKGVYVGRVQEYNDHAKDPKKRLVYQAIVQDLKDNKPIKPMARKYGVSRTLIYRIRKEL